MDFDFSPIVDNWRFFAGGLGTTVALSGGGRVQHPAGPGDRAAALYGPRWLRPLLVFYIDSMRAIPVLVVLVWIYFALPLLAGVNFAPFWAALVALTLHIAAYAAEVVRAGIESVRPGQMRAGLALGMSRAQALRKIILPQAIVRMLPAFGSVLTVAIKDTAIATVIAVPELMHKAETIAGQSYRPIEVYTAVLVAYFVILFPVTRGWTGCTNATHIWGAHESGLGNRLGLAPRAAGRRGMTVLLTVATMALAVPGGIVLALMRLSSNRLASKAATVFVEFSATCR